MHQRRGIGRFPASRDGAFTPWRGEKEVSGVTLVVAQEVPASSSMAVPHGPAGVGRARHRMRDQLRAGGVADAVIDDAVLILSELLSNAYRHGRPLRATSRDCGTAGEGVPGGDGDVRAAWRVGPRGRLTVEVTDGGGPTRPVPAKPSISAHGGRGLNIITALADEWGVRDDAPGEVTVWAVLGRGHRHEDFATRITASSLAAGPGPGDLGDHRATQFPEQFPGTLPGPFSDPYSGG
ncbi:ATP-binding protein [Streptomyces tsukubensis]|uniref:ATP-binding protein n=1 Tax=Streptomyces tsukubensis TaxID=83656 RepID=UPI00098F8449|nr:ATP-binding protein [Streptomyces tsukubensis]QFR94688.1 ATP-binding protein [Streptomyces tsukubensis]